MRGRTTALIVTTAAVLTALSGCTEGSAPPAAGEGASRALTRAEQARVDQAEQRLIQGCMKRNGFRYWVEPPAGADTVRAFTNRFVQDDVEWAREHGYGGRLRKAFLAAKNHDPNLAYRKRLSPAERERFSDVLDGGSKTRMLSVRLPAGGAVRTLDGGCRHSARQKLFGDTKVYFRTDKIATNLVAVYTPEIRRDPRFAKGLDAWSRCMREAVGRGFAEPDAARAHARERAGGLSTSGAHAVEVELAVAEADCARKTSLRSTLSRLDREHGDPVRDRYADEITTSNRLKLAALREAKRLDLRG
ncbi:hypothetical protein ACFPA8_21050 [Streptomyces ovatisporus]|uniref:Lipoprotein n=1 Tax=Streptomyces ovatisporus TaxID=1128682 RepID=A0ABV9ACG2_9ACTN